MVKIDVDFLSIEIEVALLSNGAEIDFVKSISTILSHYTNIYRFYFNK
jgi:hypothetical protein